jgi:hypothetical protein
MAPVVPPAATLALVAVFVVVSSGAAVGLLVDAGRRIRFQRRARQEFEHVDATVVDAALHEPAGGGDHAVPHVEYEYNVDGEWYTSRSLWPTRSPSPDPVDRELARRVVEDHRSALAVIAHYDPEDPSTAYLLEEFGHTGERLELAVGVLLLVVSMVVAWLAAGGPPAG